MTDETKGNRILIALAVAWVIATLVSLISLATGAAPATEQPRPEPPDWRLMLTRCDSMTWASTEYSLRMDRDGGWWCQHASSVNGSSYVGTWRVRDGWLTVSERCEGSNGSYSTYRLRLRSSAGLVIGRADSLNVVMWRSRTP